MLEKIAIRNVNSIDYCELDLTKANYRYAEENVDGPVVNPIAIYGHNGSGKSSILSAIAHFISMMSVPPEAVSAFVVNNFLFEKYHSSGRTDASLIRGSVELFFDISGKKYDYFLETSRDNYVSREFLKIDGATYFENNEGQYSLNGSAYDINSKTTSRIIPFLRILASSEIVDATIQTVFNYVKSFTHVNAALINRGACVTSNIFTFASADSKIDQRQFTIFTGANATLNEQQEMGTAQNPPLRLRAPLLTPPFPGCIAGQATISGKIFPLLHETVPQTHCPTPFV